MSILGQAHRSLSGWLLLLVLLCPTAIFAADEFTFELEEFAKKALKMGGYAELKWEHMDINQSSAFSLLNPVHNLSSLDRFSGSLQLDGRYDQGISSFNWRLKASAQQDNIGWYDRSDVYEAYGSIKPTPLFTGSIGKKSYKWGKGYAWNPIGFINRRKDPNDPDEALEGYITTEIDLIKSYTGALRTAALTTVILPVWDDFNDDFGEVNHLNLATKLYFLFLDTDIDLILYTGNSRSSRYGLDFSKNMASNFEIHGEWAYVPRHRKVTLNENNSVVIQNTSATSYLLGLRYLSENELTSIIEFYHNGAGYSEDEMTRFYQLIEDGANEGTLTGSRLLDKARELSLKGYGRPQPGRDYIYARFSQKEPFDILYFTPALTTMINMKDQSYSVMPELIYTGLTNWELRIRFSYFNGGSSTEYNEKLFSNKLELRLRFFF